MSKSITIDLSNDVKAQVIQMLKQVESTLPFLLNLSPVEKHRLPKMGRKMMKFVETSFGYSANHPGLVPQYVDTRAWALNCDSVKRLFEIMEVLGPLWEKVSDTYYAVGGDAYASARIFYKSLKAAEKAGLPGIDSIMKELSSNFPRFPSAETILKRKEEAAAKKAAIEAKASEPVVRESSIPDQV